MTAGVVALRTSCIHALVSVSFVHSFVFCCTSGSAAVTALGLTQGMASFKLAQKTSPCLAIRDALASPHRDQASPVLDHPAAYQQTVGADSKSIPKPY